jgi:hypothetical protein
MIRPENEDLMDLLRIIYGKTYFRTIDYKITGKRTVKLTVKYCKKNSVREAT